MLKPRNNKKEKMSQQDAFDLIDDWLYDMEVRLIDQDREDVKNEIWISVQKERLSFDREKGVFTYKLNDPIKDIDGNDVHTILQIKECNLERKRGMSKKKDDIDIMAALYAAYCTTIEGDDIPIGFMTRIMDRDQNILSAVILGFFVQAVPGKMLQK